MEQYLTIEDVATRYPFIPEATWRYWRHKGTGPRSAKLGRRVVYRESEVVEWIDAQFGDKAPGPAA